MFLIGRLRCAQSTSSANEGVRSCSPDGLGIVANPGHRGLASFRIRLPPRGIGENRREFRGAGAPHTRKVNLQNEANSGPLCETKPKLLAQVPPAPPKPIEDPT